MNRCDTIGMNYKATICISTIWHDLHDTTRYASPPLYLDMQVNRAETHMRLHFRIYRFLGLVHNDNDLHEAAYTCKLCCAGTFEQLFIYMPHRNCDCTFTSRPQPLWRRSSVGIGVILLIITKPFHKLRMHGSLARISTSYYMQVPETALAVGVAYKVAENHIGKGEAYS